MDTSLKTVIKYIFITVTDVILIKSLACNSINIVAVQESWEKEDSKIDVDGYKWFGKPRTSRRSQRKEGGLGS